MEWSLFHFVFGGETLKTIKGELLRENGLIPPMGLALVHGYVLIKAVLGKAIDVAAAVGKVKGVRNHCAVTGSFDVIATFDVKELADVANVVVKGIHHIEGVCQTQTAICVHCK